MKKRLQKNQSNKIFCGVCSGLGEYFSQDPIVFRIIFVVLAFFRGFGFLFYLFLAIFLPSKDNFFEEDDTDVRFLITSGPDSPHPDQEFDSYFKD